MRRVLLTALVVVGAAALALVATGAKDDGGGGGKRYWVQLDNAFGLVEGADVKVGGVRAGKITELKVDRKARKALVGIDVQEKGFDSFRTDVFCTTRPQSLIGEYFIDCQPGKARRELDSGAKIPVRRTASTIAPDLVNNILRLPYAERLRIILMELGAGVASRAEDLNAAIRRGVPALRETDRVLAILADQNQVLADLVRNGDEVISALADNKEDVGRFVVEANDTAEASAARSDALASTFRRFPGFLRELRPTMSALGRVADEQTPALRNLSASSAQLTRFFNNLGPFAEASRPAIRSLGDASVVGSDAVRSAGETVSLLRTLSTGTPEVAKNLAIILEWLDDRDNAVENDARSPGGRGFTGLEALLQYVFDQGQAINVFDQNGYLLKVSLFASEECGPYADAKRVKENPEIYKECASPVGPNQPGVTTPDVGTQPVSGSDLPPLQSQGGDPKDSRRSTRSEERERSEPRSTGEKDDGERERKPSGDRDQDRGGSKGGGNDDKRRPPKIDEKVAEVVKDVLEGKLPPTALPPELQNLPLPGLNPGAGSQQQPSGTPSTDQLLDYLLGG